MFTTYLGNVSWFLHFYCKKWDFSNLFRYFLILLIVICLLHKKNLLRNVRKLRFSAKSCQGHQNTSNTYTWVWYVRYTNVLALYLPTLVNAFPELFVDIVGELSRENEEKKVGSCGKMEDNTGLTRGQDHGNLTKNTTKISLIPTNGCNFASEQN